MDTRQLAAFCAVVERQSFSQAAAALGVTQPAVSLQVRSLEKRLGRQLLDRSGRRVVAAEDDGILRGRLEVGASTGPGGTVLALLLCEFQRRNPGLTVALSVHDTRRIVELVANRELELGVVGATRRQRSVSFEPFFRDE